MGEEADTGAAAMTLPNSLNWLLAGIGLAVILGLLEYWRSRMADRWERKRREREAMKRFRRDD